MRPRGRNVGIVIVVFASVFLSGCQSPTTPGPAGTAHKTLGVASDAFAPNTAIPTEFTCDGEDASPPLRFSNLPGGAGFLALVMDDPDAPQTTYTHWVFWNLPGTVTSLAKGADLSISGAREGTNGNGSTGYIGPCPPPGETHRYFFKVYATERALDLESGATAQTVTSALSGKVLSWGELVGTYRSP